MSHKVAKNQASAGTPKGWGRWGNAKRARWIEAMQPCEHPPGSPGKILHMQLRTEFNLPPCDPRYGDAPDCEEDEGLLLHRHAANGAPLGRSLVRMLRDGSDELQVIDPAPVDTEAPRPIRPSIAKARHTDAYKQAECERKRRERQRQKQEREEAGADVRIGTRGRKRKNAGLTIKPASASLLP